jgi:hypothetical protein
MLGSEPTSKSREISPDENVSLHPLQHPSTATAICGTTSEPWKKRSIDIREQSASSHRLALLVVCLLTDKRNLNDEFYKSSWFFGTTSVV